MTVREIAYQNLTQDKSLQIFGFEEDLAQEWDRFVWSSNNGTIFHTRKFLNYHPRERFQDASLILAKERKWLALLPAVIRQDNSSKVLISHAGASLGGPVTKSNLSVKDAFRLVEALLQYAAERGLTQLILTLTPQFYYWRPSNYLDFALLDFGFDYVKREVSSVIPLDFAAEDTLLIFSPESRRAVRRGIKLGVKVRPSDDLETFYALLKRNLKLRHNVQPTHTLQELRTLKQIWPRRIKLFSALLNERMLAGLLIFVCNEKVALAFYISHDEQMQEYRAVNLLFYEVVRWAIGHQLRFLDFGIFTVNMIPNWGLAKFKESFGAQGLFRDTLSKTL